MVPEEKIKPGTTIKIKTWDEIKRTHERELLQNDSYRPLYKFLKLHAGKKRTVNSIYKLDKNLLRIYIKEEESNKYMYFLLEEIAYVYTIIELDKNLFEL